MSRLKSPPDHYDVLGLTPGATAEEIKSSFVRLIRPFNRRLQENTPEQVDQARQINLAYLTLGDPAKRRAYDASRGSSEGALAETAASIKQQSGAFVAPDRQDAPDALATAEDEKKSRTSARRARSRAIATPAPAAPDELERQRPKASERPAPASSKSSVSPPVALAGLAGGANGSGPKHDIPETLLAQRKAVTAASDGATSESGVTGPPEPPQDVESFDEAPSSNRRKAALAGVGMLVLVGSLAALSTQVDWSGSPTAPAAHHGRDSATAGVAPAATSAQPAAPQRSPIEALLSGDLLDPSAVPPPPETKLVQKDKLAAASSQGSAVPVRPEAGQKPEANAEDAPAEASVNSVPETPAQVAEAPQPMPLPAPASAVVSLPVPSPNRAAPAEQISGGLFNSDNPRGQYRGTVNVRFVISTTGRAAGCRTLTSSGNPALDARTCALVEQRLKFRPALNRDGQPVPSQMDGTYTWGKRERGLTSRVLNFIRPRRP